MIRPRRVATIVGTVATLAGLGGPALAQVFDKFNESAREEMPATPFVAGAYAFIWVALLAYVFLIARGLRRAEADVAELRRRLDAHGAHPPASAGAPSATGPTSSASPGRR